MKRSWIDISMPIHNKMVGWPGNPPTRIEPHLSIARGDVCNVSRMEFNSHMGTHMDAPLHFLHRAKSMDAMPFEAVIGPARVLEIKDPESIRPEELKRMRLRRGERILFKTRNSGRSWKMRTFDKRFVYIAKEGAQFLVDRGIQTVGVDYFSVGGFYKDGIETHHVLLGAEVWIIEGLNLEGVKPGNYDLLCLPIKFKNGDGAPARCLIRPR